MADQKTPVSPERLRELFDYSSETGVFTRKTTAPGFGRAAGSTVGTIDEQGYLRCIIDGRRYKMHRLAWLYVHGTWPSNDIDHINGIRSDNRLVNLRDVARRTNAENQRRARKENKAGRLGVKLHANGRWEARIGVAGKQKYIGIFETADAAHAAYVSEKRRLHQGCTL